MSNASKTPAFEVRISPVVSFWMLFAVYLLAHWELWFRHISAPTFGWRPTDLAGIAINYYRNGFHFFYPQVMWGGAGAGHVEMELPLQSFLTAILFKVFGQHDALNEVFPLAFGFGIVWVTAALARYRYGDVAGVAAGLGVALSPTQVHITTYGMWADPPMVFFGALGVYWLLRWSDAPAAPEPTVKARESTWRLWAGAAAVSMAILCKITGLYLGFVVLYLFVRRYGRHVLLKPETWLAAAIMLLPSVAWYAHAYQMYLEDGNTFGILAAGSLKLGTASTLTDLSIYKRTLIRVAFYHVTPLAFLGFLYGCYLSLIRRDAFVFTWLGAIAIHAFVAFQGLRYAGHIGYLLTVLPICNLVAGLGVQAALGTVRSWLGERWRPPVIVPLMAALGFLVLVNTAVAYDRFNYRDLAFETALWEGKRLTGVKVAQLTRPGSLIVVADHEMDGLTPKTWMTPPDVFFFGDRRGWYFALSWATPERIEDVRAKGAEYFVVSANSLTQYAEQYPALDAYLRQHYRKVTDQDGIIYDLRQ